MQLSQPTLEPHSLCYTCCVQVVYSLLPTLLFFLLGTFYCCSVLPTQGSSLRASKTTRTSRHSSPSRRPCGALLGFGEFLPYLYFASAVPDIFFIIEINNIRIRFIMYFYVICAMIYCSFCCIYMWLDPGTYMIARFMSFYKPGVTHILSFHS